MATAAPSATTDSVPFSSSSSSSSSEVVATLPTTPDASTGSQTAASEEVGNSSSSSSVATVDEQAEIKAALIDWYATNFYENETQLLGIPNCRTNGLRRADKPCAQLPSLQTRSSSILANGQCPAQYANLSCTCLLGYIRDDRNEFWEFKVKKKTSTTALPRNLDAEDVLEIDAIATIWAPGTLKGLCVATSLGATYHHFSTAY